MTLRDAVLAYLAVIDDPEHLHYQMLAALAALRAASQEETTT